MGYKKIDFAKKGKGFILIYINISNKIKFTEYISVMSFYLFNTTHLRKYLQISWRIIMTDLLFYYRDSSKARIMARVNDNGQLLQASLLLVPSGTSVFLFLSGSIGRVTER